MADTKQDLYLVLYEERNHGIRGPEQYFHIRGRIAGQKYDDHQMRPDGPDDTYSDGLLYSGLKISCQGDEHSRKNPVSQCVYGFASEYYDLYSLDLRKAKRIVKTLEKLDRGLSKISEARGYVKSYGEYCGRVAEVLGCKGMAYRREPERAISSGTDWEWLSIGEGVNKINHRIYLWHQEAIEQAAASETQA